MDAGARTPRWKAIGIAAAAALAIALLGGLSTDIGSWYASLHEPAWKPPDAWFGPAWTLIYAFTAMAGVTGWRAAPPRRRIGLLAAYALNAFLNVFWSLLFFRLHRPDWALAEVLFLWASIVLLVALSWRFSRRAVLLLLPYLLWVAFAGWLNLAVVRLNGPF